MQSSTLVVFCKRPKLGQGKQRLAADIGPAKALKVAEHLLACAIDDAREWQAHSDSAEVVISPASSQDVDWAANLMEGASVVAQPEGNLGERLNAIDRQLYKAGHHRRLFIGTDAPGLMLEQLRRIDDQLDRFDVVLQPSSDGGVTVMATKHCWPRLTALPWSTNRLQQALSSQCLISALSVQLQSVDQDIDDWNDLVSMQSALHQDQRATRQMLAECIASLSEQAARGVN